MAMNIHNTECCSGLSVLSFPWPSIQKRIQKTNNKKMRTVRNMEWLPDREGFDRLGFFISEGR